MMIRKTDMGDFGEICRIYADARDFMRESGNPSQWRDDRPSIETVERDILEGASYVCTRSDAIVAVFFFIIGNEPTYGRIMGAWLNNDPYGVVHRIARARGASGAGSFCMDWCYEQCRNLRVDTHRDNAPMRRLLDKLGFSYCGIIWLENGEERLAYQKAVNAETYAKL